MLKGIDLNSANNISDWNLVAKDGVQILINKATEANFYQDKYLSYRYNTVRPLGIKMGVYHFAGKHGVEIEAQYFLDYIKGYKFDTILYLDIEQPPKSYGWQWTKENAINYVNKFIDIINKAGYEIGIYTNEYFYNDFLKGNIRSDLKLWIANYSKEPEGYPNVSWQFTEVGTINGSDGKIDVNYFNENILLNGNSVNPTPNVIPVNPQQIPQSKSDPNIVKLQQVLNRLLNYQLVCDGIQGNLTTDAVKQFQKMVGINCDGIAGNQTWNVINQILSKPLLKVGSKGVVVKFMQYRIGENNDGDFGNSTRQKVINYQHSKGISADGIFGNQSWGCLIG